MKTNDVEEHLKTPLMAQYSKYPEITVSHYFKLRKNELKFFFMQEYLEMSEDFVSQYRESLNMLRKVGYTQGLLSYLASDPKTGIAGDARDIERRKAIFGENT